MDLEPQKPRSTRIVSPFTWASLALVLISVLLKGDTTRRAGLLTLLVYLSVRDIGFYVVERYFLRRGSTANIVVSDLIVFLIAGELSMIPPFYLANIPAGILFFFGLVPAVFYGIVTAVRRVRSE